ncbi:MAG: DUF1837 domain-containing protein [Cupriavidus sp.]|nr:DUF1837 domain-containing protein [Cupriavidus sp.]
MPEDSLGFHGLGAQFDQLVDRHRLDARLRRMETPDRLQPCVNAHFLYPAFQGRATSMQALARMLSSEITRFCATRQERRAARRADAVVGELETGAVERMADEARRLFMRARGNAARSGEGGELLLYALIEHFLGAPLIVSKMRLKTSPEMPVHGADGLHAAWCRESNALILYFGESKMHQDFAGAMREAAESIAGIAANANDRLDQELRLITAFHDLDSFPAEGVEHLLRFLDPFASDEANYRIDRFAVLVGFDYHAYNKLATVPLKEVEAIFLEHYATVVDQKIRTARHHLQQHHIELERVDLFLFPVPSVEEFRQCFEDVIHG